MARDVGTLAKVKIDPVQGGKLFQFLLEFRGPAGLESIEFRASAGAAMVVFALLQRHQAAYKIPIPPILPRAQGKPKLMVVSDDGP
jgi:hypothetical protein